MNLYDTTPSGYGGSIWVDVPLLELKEEAQKKWETRERERIARQARTQEKREMQSRNLRLLEADEG